MVYPFILIPGPKHGPLDDLIKDPFKTKSFLANGLTRTPGLLIPSGVGL